ncbi:glycosyltransferase [soil metagenome]
MRLSVIIVNYNVKYFLEQALYSVRKAVAGIDAEVIVVDNNSSDSSVELVREKFPEVILIANKENTGFSKANNQGIAISTGEYVLLLNPDTVVEEDCFKQCIAFMDGHPDAGALGVKMVDGKGHFLPESKRSLPTPAVSFYKIFGLAALFPRSKRFGRYHLGYLDDDKTHEIEVLAGAFMFMRRETLDKIGWLDETFFMYGEDIDLSYRVILGGYKNYYYPNARIIHYKGESTKKGSLNYVRIFYQAMAIFAKKHFSGRQAKLYALVINTAIYIRALVAIFSSVVKNFSLPLMDAGLLFGGMYVIKELWSTEVKRSLEYYPPEYMQMIVPIYILFWVVAIYFSGGYDRPLRTYRTVRGVFIGTLLIAAFYAFLDEEYRFSRGMILAGGIYATFMLVLLRYAWGWLTGSKLLFREQETPRIIIVGSKAEADRALSLLSQAGVDNRYIGFVSPLATDAHQEHYLGSVNQLEGIRKLYDIQELIFCSADVTIKTIIDSMLHMGPELNYKILPEHSLSIIGSNSKNTAGDLYAIDINLAIATPMNRRNKRLLDVGVCLATLVSYPISVFFIAYPAQFLRNWARVLVGNRSWVGYAPMGNKQKGQYFLPKIKPGILTPADVSPTLPLNDATRGRLNLLYAKDYSVYKDVRLVWRNFRCLGSC